MSIISEKVSYLRGLAEGMKLNTESNEGKLISEILGVLDEVAEDIKYLEDSQEELFDRVYELEEDVYDNEYEYDYYNNEDDDGYCLKCPNCNDEFVLGSDEFESDDDIICPRCGETIEFDCDCDDCDDSE
ncbi:MAG: hypothetical protein BWY15_01418 [Firmicutes bacterium ADurb.Bin193]|nr:MAG: hypothetical protein BWY15_01418 [Firmicutes bacterium ADurb.Bin193]